MRAQSTLHEILPPEERAIEHVVARYQRVAPAVTRVARNLAGDEELQVRLGSTASSRRRQIVLDPGVFQAAYMRRAPVTPGEVALASALHEVVHLVSTDLEERRPLPAAWFPKRESPISEDPVDLLAALEEAGGIAATSMFFALEDGRQELTGMSDYPGARSVLTDLYQSSLSSAMAAAKPLGQLAISGFAMVGEHVERDQLEKWARPDVAVALADATPFFEAVKQADDPWEVATLALQILEVAKLHGLATETPVGESATQKKLREEQDSQDVEDGVDRVRLMSPIVQNLDGYERTRQIEQRAGASDEKGPSDVADDAATDQLLRVSQAPTVFLPTGQGGRLMVSGFPQRFRHFGAAGRETLREAAAAWGVAQRHVSGELFPLFAANQRRGLRSGYDAGDISPHAPLFLGAGLYQRMYERRALRTRRSYAVSLLIDGSASMLQPRSLSLGSRTAPWGLAAATLGAWTLAHLCDELQIDFEVALFNRSFSARPDDSEWSFSRRKSQATGGLRRSQGQAADRLTNTINHYLVKPFNSRWRTSEDLLAGLFYSAAHPTRAAAEARKSPQDAPPVGMFEKAANVDEFNLSYAAERISRLGATVRVLVVLADGMTRGSLESLARSVEAVEHTGTTVLGIGIGDDTVQVAYGRNQVVERPDALANAMVEGVRGALRRSLALSGMDEWWTRAATRERMTTWKEQAGA
ncbi:MAG: hypothetical protein HKN80_06805 [Acidimicrobiia bacterium]|nr:hypothetical protein [Acidimicrobiia bacterium]NNC92186.1 hypothetical protein [Acidimicrobiia bacterium]